MAGLLESSNTLSRWKRDQRTWAGEPVPGSKCIYHNVLTGACLRGGSRPLQQDGI